MPRIGVNLIHTRFTFQLNVPFSIFWNEQQLRVRLFVINLLELQRSENTFLKREYVGCW